MPVQDLTTFLRSEDDNDTHENSIGKDDALFVKSEDTLVYALLRWADHQKNVGSNESEPLQTLVRPSY